MYTTSILILLASAGVINARSLFEARHADKRHLHHLLNKHSIHDNSDILITRELAHLVQGRATSDATSLTLADSAIQKGSFVDGTQEIGANVAQQAPSLTSQNNFINVCAGKVLTNGLQITTGSCNGITMGDIPAKNLMVSSMITFPIQGSASIESDTTFTITVQMSNLVAGSFTNADATYYAAPQTLSGGMVVGHTHVTVQDMGATLNPTTPLDPTKFAFFKGINDVGNGQGLLSANVTGGLPAGNYRVCTLASSSNHQPVIMPVAQRGTSDDCTKFTVIGNGKTANVASNDGVNGDAAAALAASAVANGAGNPAPAVSVSSSSSSISETTTAQAVKDTTTTKASKNTNKGKGNAFATSSFNFSNTTTSATQAVSTTSISKNSDSGSGKGGKVTKVFVKKIVIIVSFFEFSNALGGLCPSISKSLNGKFAILEEIFDDLISAASSACNTQFSACESFSGDGFSVEECVTQKVSCSSAASTAKASSSAVKVTGTVVVPASVSVAGSVVSQATFTTTVDATSSTAIASVAAVISQTSAASKPIVTQPAAVGDAQTSGSVCVLSTSTVFVDAPAITALPIAIAVSSTCAALVTSTVFVDEPASTASSISTPVSSSVASVSSGTGTVSAAIGGITAPAITNSGDSSRSFEVNGNTFVNEAAALQRSCDVQFNACANAVNGGTLAGVTLADCSTQETACITA